MNSLACKNCGNAVADSFCPRCGQSAGVGRLQFRELAGQVLDALVDWDGRLWTTLRGLTLRPGQVCAEYVDGRRQSYVPPLRYCLLALLLNLLIGQFISVEIDADLPASMSAEQQQAFHALFLEFRQLAVAHADWVALIGVPLIALLYRLLMWGRQRNLAECMAFALYLCGHISVLMALFSPIKWLGPGAAALLRVLVLSLMYCIAARVFFAVGWWRALISSLLVVAASFLISFLALIALAWWQGSLQPAIAVLRAG